MFNIITTDPSKNSYYYPILLLIFVVFILLELLILAIKNDFVLNIDKNNNNNTLFSNVSYSMTFIKNKNSLKIRYLICYIFVRAAMWAKAPYLYTLFEQYINLQWVK